PLSSLRVEQIHQQFALARNAPNFQMPVVQRPSASVHGVGEVLKVAAIKHSERRRNGAVSPDDLALHGNASIDTYLRLDLNCASPNVDWRLAKNVASIFQLWFSRQ